MALCSLSCELLPVLSRFLFRIVLAISLSANAQFLISVFNSSVIAVFTSRKLEVKKKGRGYNFDDGFFKLPDLRMPDFQGQILTYIII